MDTYKSLNILYQLRGCQPLCTILLPEALGAICQSNTQIYVSQLTSLLLHPDNNIEHSTLPILLLLFCQKGH